ncbi:MAG: M20/M25/M40 family metallo-hydrolase [Mollicutes bacterium PWAP]|nr:M20/M25/M40 family metallo-hydrolase [Mollicutes bacterium PWAP]
MSNKNKLENKRYDQMFEIYKKYCEINGISRFEEPVAQMLKDRTKDYGLEYSRDGLGSLIMKKGNIGPKIQIAAHMDEVGFLVSDINKEGFLKLFMVGGIRISTILGTKATVQNSKGKNFFGIFGHTSIHIMTPKERKEVSTLEKLYVDLGFTSKEEVLEAGIGIGDKVFLNGDSFRSSNPDRVIGKAQDNRTGVYILEEIARIISNENIKNQTYLVGTVQEEIGTRGAITSVSKIKPDLAIAIDTLEEHSVPYAQEGVTKIGNGAALRITDGGIMTDPKLVDFVMKIAKKNNITAYKYIAKGGGTDSRALQYGEGGVPSLTIGIPQRYLHAPLGMISLFDIQQVIDLVVEVIKSINNKVYKNELIYK